MCLLSRLFEGSGHVLAMVMPRFGQVCRSAECSEAHERSHILRVNLEIPPQPTADMGCGSRNEILHCEHRQPRSRVQHPCPRQCPTERSEQINAKSALPVNELKQRLAFGRGRMDVIQ